jgi:hypothetical protein
MKARFGTRICLPIRLPKSSPLAMARQVGFGPVRASRAHSITVRTSGASASVTG